jgi:hypothetical protein
MCGNSVCSCRTPSILPRRAVSWLQVAAHLGQLQEKCVFGCSLATGCYTFGTTTIEVCFRLQLGYRLLHIWDNYKRSVFSVAAWLHVAAHLGQLQRKRVFGCSLATGCYTSGTTIKEACFRLQLGYRLLHIWDNYKRSVFSVAARPQVAAHLRQLQRKRVFGCSSATGCCTFGTTTKEACFRLQLTHKHTRSVVRSIGWRLYGRKDVLHGKLSLATDTSP